VSAAWWVLVERDDPDREPEPDLIVGPYPDEPTAFLAMEHSLLIEGFCEESATDCYLVNRDPEPGEEQVLVDLTDPHHLGEEPEILTGA